MPNLTLTPPIVVIDRPAPSPPTSEPGRPIAYAAIAVIAGHYDLDHRDVVEALEELPVSLSQLFSSRQGWIELGRQVALLTGVGAFPPMSVTLH